MHAFRAVRPAGALRRALAVGVLLVVPVFAGGTSTQAAPVTNLIWLTEQGAAIVPIVASFNKTHPTIHVTTQVLTTNELWQQILVRLGSGAATPDIIDADGPLVASYAVQGYLAPLDSVFSAADRAQYVPATLSTGMYGGHMWAAPFFNSSQVLYYNKDLLQKAGIPFPPNDVNKRLTWEQLATEAQKATVRSGNTVTAWGFVPEQIDRPYQLLPMPQSLGGQGLSADGLHASGIINSPAWIKAFTWYYDLFNTWKISPVAATDDVTSGLFTAGHVAFFWGGEWDAPGFAAAKGLHWGFAPTPYFAGGKPVTPNDGWHLAINRHSKNFAAAATFIRYMSLGAGADAYAHASFSTPTLLRTAHTIATDSSFATFPNNVLRLTAYESDHTAVARPETPGFNEYADILTQAFNNIRTGQSAKTALDAAATQIDTALAKYARVTH